jgi:hypothetical protein
MDLTTYERETAINRKAYDGLKDQIRRDYAGQYVALGLGRVLAVAPTFDETKAAVEQMQPAPEYFLIFPAEDDPPFELVYDF